MREYFLNLLERCKTLASGQNFGGLYLEEYPYANEASEATAFDDAENRGGRRQMMITFCFTPLCPYATVQTIRALRNSGEFFVER